jgi:hypothetical protein
LQQGAKIGHTVGVLGNGFPLPRGSGLLGGFAGLHKLNVGDCCAMVLQGDIKKRDNGKTV